MAFSVRRKFWRSGADKFKSFPRAGGEPAFDLVAFREQPVFSPAGGDPGFVCVCVTWIPACAGKGIHGVILEFHLHINCAFIECGRTTIRHSSGDWNPAHAWIENLDWTGSQPSLGRRLFDRSSQGLLLPLIEKWNNCQL